MDTRAAAWLPIPQKFNLLYLRGDVAVWAYYGARLLIGFVVGISVWPSAWYLRGPLCGFFTMLPVSIVSLATPRSPRKLRPA